MTYIADMDACQPQSALSKTAQPNHWRLVEYESDEVSGTMLAAGPLTDAPDVIYPLEQGGWHAIYVGYWNANIGDSQRVAVKVKLTSDPYFTPIVDDEGDELISSTLREAFWKYADLTGEQIGFGQLTRGAMYPGYPAYLRLEPLSDDRVKQIQAERADTTKRVVIPTNDCGALLNGKASTEADICEQIEIYRHSDVGRLDWAVCYGDMVTYPSQVGWRYYEGWHEDPPRVSDAQSEESLRTLNGKGLIPHKVAMAYAHAIGIEFYAMIRIGIGTFVPPMDVIGGIYAERPELRCLARDGTPLPKISYAYPEVRELMLDIIREVADDELDGINLCFMRGVPLIGCEEPVVQALKEQYGVDLSDVSDDDERLARVRSSFVTDFMRQVRIIADEVGERRGRPLIVSVMANGTLDGGLLKSCDIRTWVEEKLVDEMVAVAVLTQYLHANGVRHIIYVGPDGPAAYMSALLTCAEAGSDGVMVWDMNGVQELSDHWALLRQLGHTDRVIDHPDELAPLKRIPLTKVGDVDVTHTAPWGGVHKGALLMYTNG